MSTTAKTAKRSKSIRQRIIELIEPTVSGLLVGISANFLNDNSWTFIFPIVSPLFGHFIAGFIILQLYEHWDKDYIVKSKEAKEQLESDIRKKSQEIQQLIAIVNKDSHILQEINFLTDEIAGHRITLGKIRKMEEKNLLDKLEDKQPNYNR